MFKRSRQLVLAASPLVKVTHSWTSSGNQKAFAGTQGVQNPNLMLRDCRTASDDRRERAQKHTCDSWRRKPRTLDCLRRTWAEQSSTKTRIARKIVIVTCESALGQTRFAEWLRQRWFCYGFRVAKRELWQVMSIRLVAWYLDACMGYAVVLVLMGDICIYIYVCVCVCTYVCRYACLRTATSTTLQKVIHILKVRKKKP